MKALIKTENSNRIAQVEPDNKIFPVSAGLQWIDCPDDCTTEWAYNNGQFNQPISPVPTQAEIQARYSQLAQNMMDEKARERNYDGIISACSYSTSTNPKFAAEADICVAWRDAVWSKCYELLASVLSGEMEIPSEEAFINMLPTMVWPEDVIS